jgi:AraC-like DNA-binding protein
MFSRVLDFSDPFQFQSAIQSVTHAEILPTAKGSFYVELTKIGMDRLRMQRFKAASPLIATTTIEPDRKVIGFLLEPIRSEMHHCGMKVSSSDILILNNDAVHQRSTANYFYGTMSVPADDFPELCQTIMGRAPLEKPRSALVRPSPFLLSRLRKLHDLVGLLARDTPDMLELPEICRALEQQLIHLMIRCITDGEDVAPAVKERRSSAILSRFEDFSAANPDRPIYLAEMCAAVGASERTLRAACEEHLGMGPIRFLTLRRMHLVRRALLRADPQKSTVTSIVTGHGFWELGHFSAAYRTLFGETPSVTLRSPAINSAVTTSAADMTWRSRDRHLNRWTSL